MGSPVAEHSGCRWEQVGDCVSCADHGVRLYQGAVPTDPETIEAIGQLIKAAEEQMRADAAASGPKEATDASSAPKEDTDG